MPANPTKAIADSLVSGVVRGEPAAVSRALNWISDEREGFELLRSLLFGYGGASLKIGLCGPPGCGKSSLISRLVGELKACGKVGILAVDPTSPFTGGAFLGDRIRMQSHALDPGVFMRSLASRGSVGGVASGIFGAIHVLEAYGCANILIETVGTGQDEVEVSKVVDTVVYVTTPFLGDEIQAMKAGTMEIGDVFVVNKSDMGDSHKAVSDIRRALGLGPGKSDGGWEPRVLSASAASGQGVPEVLKAVLDHSEHLKASGEGRKRRKAQVLEEVSLYVSRKLHRDIMNGISDRDLENLLDKKTDPVAVGDGLVLRNGKSDGAVGRRKPRR